MLSKKDSDFIVKNVYMNNTLLVRRLVEKKVNVGCPIELRIKKDVKIKFIILTESMEKQLDITEEDIRIQDAIYTFLKYGICEVNIEQLAGLMQGDFNRRITAERIAFIKERIKVLNKIHIKINASNQFATYKRLKNTYAIFEGKVLDVQESAQNGKNGKLTTVYQIKSVPVLYQYAETLRQVISLNRKAFMCLKGNLSRERLDVYFELLYKLCIHTNKKNKLCRNHTPIILFGWDKNKKKMNGIIGKRMKKFDKRKSDVMLQFIYETLEELYSQELIPAYQIKKQQYVFFNQRYMKVQIVL